MSTPEIDHFRLLRVRLDDREANLRSELRAVDGELDDDANQHFNGEEEDTGDEGERRLRTAVRSAEQERDIGELRDIAMAKTRMASGDYGSCADCGIDIPAARLEAQPTALRCIACQERFESKNPSALAVRLPPME